MYKIYVKINKLIKIISISLQGKVFSTVGNGEAKYNTTMKIITGNNSSI